MKKLILLIVGIFILSGNGYGLEKLGVVAVPGFSGFSLGLREWGYSTIGFEQRFGFSWNFKTLYGNIKPMFRFKKTERKYTYFFMTAGYFHHKSSDEYGSVNLNSFYLGAGLGLEFLRGYNNSWSFSPEIGFVYGKAKMTIRYNNPYFGEYEDTETFRFPPIYVGIVITKYLK